MPLFHNLHLCISFDSVKFPVQVVTVRNVSLQSLMLMLDKHLFLFSLMKVREEGSWISVYARELLRIFLV